MTDAANIEMLKSRFCKASSFPRYRRSLAARLLADILCEDAIAEYGGGHPLCRVEIIRFAVRHVHERFLTMTSEIGPGSIRVTGDEAEGCWASCVRTYDPQTRNLLSRSGRFTDRFIKTDGIWKLARIHWEEK
ncbi:MAG TPA: nuclear transport factor 2 family protein [Sphingobium sp.]|uniref:nuclear transport factor 2 family protein n=1 Tax=Sphingobium sp. TaxID=1912891 RepID=UPI002ED1A5F2